MIEIDLSTYYAGLRLKSPLIVGSCPLSRDPKKLKELADGGAAAVVMYSLFEEDVQEHSKVSLQDQSAVKHTEAWEYIHEMGKFIEPDSYMDAISDVRSSVDIPVIASLNSVSPKWWKDYAYGLERAGAAAIELNLSVLHLDNQDEVNEKNLIAVIKELTKNLGIPLTLKIPPHFASKLKLMQDLSQAGIKGFVYFNRYYLPDIKLPDLTLMHGPILSEPVEYYTPLRFAALHAPLLNADIALSTGVHSTEQVIKGLLVGAQAVQLVSTLMRNGTSQMAKLHSELKQWLADANIYSLAQLRGKLSLDEQQEVIESFQRLQYVKTLRF